MLSLSKMGLFRILFVVGSAGVLGALLLPSSAAQESAAPSVAEIAVGTGVEDRVLTGRAESFPAGTEALVCWTDLRGASGTTVTHAWIHEGITRARVEIEARSDRWRCWSSKRLLPEWTGAWEVKVLTADGAVLASTSFTVE